MNFNELFIKLEKEIPNHFKTLLNKGGMVCYDFQYNIKITNSPIYSLEGSQTPSFNHENLLIEIPDVFLRYLWIVNIYIYINLNVYELQFDKTLEKERLAELSLANTTFATQLLEIGYKYKTEYFEWPDEIWLPGFDFGEQDFADQMTKSFLNSILFAYSHEYMHGWYDHYNELKKLALEIGYEDRDIFDKMKIAHELDADRTSIRLLLAEDKNYAIPILIFFSATFLLIREKTTRDHIDLFDRFDLVFDQLKIESSNPMWLIPSFIILPDEALSEVPSSIDTLSEQESCESIYRKMLTEYRKRYIP
ncbi:hypothetical protein EHQ91_15915 [Leptospira biflexa]|uniref:hypothetical protein n=1 Tax=Leptospira biflexa TaxID=172 RepID=UPI00109175F8|nr:hypothetical protein [Leptospira biflexa]TGM52703.1 hypothetical protein EHQ91_15915 [Leptospira biflexa]